MSESKFVVCKDQDYASENAYYSECVSRRVPLVVVNTKRRYSDVTWDHITLPSNWDDLLLSNADEIATRIVDVARRCSTSRPRIRGGAIVGTIYNLQPDAAESAAAEIFDILATYLAEAN